MSSFFPVGDSPFAASLLEVLSNTVLNVFLLIWNVVSQVPGVSSAYDASVGACCLYSGPAYSYYSVVCKF